VSSGKRVLLVSAAVFAAILLTIVNSTGDARKQAVAADTESFTPRIKIEYGESRLTTKGDIRSSANETILRLTGISARSAQIL